jgi:hypothetical protein
LKTWIDAGRGADEICAAWEADEDAFARLREPYLLYS